jgi:hypothetical protein
MCWATRFLRVFFARLTGGDQVVANAMAKANAFLETLGRSTISILTEMTLLLHHNLREGNR